MIDRDHGAKALIARLRKGIEVHVGVLGRKAEARHVDSDLTVGEIAAIHEFGIDVPRRSFVRDTIDQEEAKAKSLLKKAGAAIFRAVAPERAAKQLGEAMVAAMKARINANIPPALSPVTVAKKGHDLALVDTGQLYDAIGYEVEVTRG